MFILEKHLRGLARCPHCSIANPNLVRFGELHWQNDGLDNQLGAYWGSFVCSSCKKPVLAEGEFGVKSSLSKIITVENTYPDNAKMSPDLPDTAKTYLQQAFESLHAPDGAAMLAGAAVDAMLKAKGYIKKSLYERIKEAVESGVLTPDMGAWAHEVRLESNRPRHADIASPHVSAEEAIRSCEFARVLGEILFVLPARIKRGRITGTSDIELDDLQAEGTATLTDD